MFQFISGFLGRNQEIRGRSTNSENISTINTRASLIDQLVKSPPAMWETWVQSLGWEDPLEKEKAIHSSILA